MIDSFRDKYSFLSNYTPVKVKLDGEEYPTVEHAFQAAKTVDLIERAEIRKAATPGDAKKLGRKASLRLDWETTKIAVMKDLLEQKFAVESYKGLLLKTGDQELVEGNTWGDIFWGVCNGNGENHLGKLLMEIRATLKASRPSYNTTMDDLQVLRRLTSELNATNSTTDKVNTLKKFPECKKILRWTYDPFKIYYITSDNLKKKPRFHTGYTGKYPTFTNIYDLLEALDSRKLSGHEALASVWHFIDANRAYAELIMNILDRNLKTRVDAKLINKVWPGTVPSFEVALANKYSDVKDKVNFAKDAWYASRKLDGVRVITIMLPNGDIKFLSRKGKEFLTLEKVREELKKKLTGFDLRQGIVIDGEMCIVNKNGDENFTDMIKLIRRKDFTVPNPKYKIFDILPLEVFEMTTMASPLLHERIATIEALKKRSLFDGNILDPVEQRRIKTEKDLTEFMAEATSKSWEGLILRKDVAYEGKRSNDMLKVKEMQDMEFIVKDVEMGPIRIIKNGKEITETMLSAIKVPFKNNIVSVGSGFSIEQRQDFYKDPSKIIGKTVTVQYFEETKNEQGLYSLRFPVVKAIYDGKRDF